eukprot:4607429-Lingulodinium_polyedra.AAC.1
MRELTAPQVLRVGRLKYLPRLYATAPPFLAALLQGAKGGGTWCSMVAQDFEALKAAQPHASWFAEFGALPGAEPALRE